MRDVTLAILKSICALLGGVILGTIMAYASVALLKVIEHHPWDWAHGDDNWVMSIGLVVGGPIGAVFGWKLGSRLRSGSPK